MPGVRINIQDFNLGSVAGVSDVVQVVGPASSGSLNTVTRIAKINDVNDAFGYGPMPFLAQRIIQQTGKAVDCIRCAASTVATGSAVTKTGSGASIFLGPIAPYDQYEGSVKITTTGAPGTGFFKASFDGGQNYTPPAVIPTSFTSSYAPENVRIIWANSSYTEGDEHTFTTSPPVAGASDISSACAAAYGTNSLTPPFVAVAQPITTGSQGAAIGSQMLTELANYQNVKQYPLAVVNAGTGSVGEIVPAWSAIENKFLAVVRGTCRMVHPRPQPGYGLPKVPYHYSYVAKAAQVLPPTSPAAVFLGGDQGVSSVDVDDRISGGNNGTWLPFNFIAPSTFPGSGAIYPMQSRMKAPAGSDYQNWEWARIVSIATYTLNQFLQRYVNSNFRVKTDGSGQIQEQDAQAVEGDAQRVFDGLLMDPVDERGKKNWVSGYRFSIDRTNNLLSTSKLNATLRIVTLAKAVDIEASVGLAASL